jgi:tetratricopeptide (TPR) repeat protein
VEVTAWDILVCNADTDEELVEVKASPTHADVIEWLDRVQRGSKSQPQRSFRFVYAKDTPLLLSLDRLIRMSRESGDDEAKFSRLMKLEKKPHFEEAIQHLGGRSARSLLQRIELTSLPETFLAETVTFRARALASQLGGAAISDRLYSKFSKAMSQRSSFGTADLLAEVKALGIELQIPPDAGAMQGATASAAFVLQYLHAPILIPVLATGIGVSVDELRSALSSKAFVVRDYLCEANVFARRVHHPYGGLLLSSTLEALLAHIASHKTDPSGLSQVRNAVELAKECIEAKPSMVTGMYDVLDKPTKRLGDKRLVLKAAEFCISAARRSNRSLRDVELEAKALICGRSWVYQRRGRLMDAREAAEESLRLGESVGDDKNTAFCTKCIGRLRRIEAEESIDPGQRKKLLDQSEALLCEAIELFGRLVGHGPRHPEVGDCYSLLGRTLLSGKRFPEARKAVKSAYNLIQDANSKDYLDLEILAGDLDAAQGRRDDAERHYDLALKMNFGGNSEVSEIFARGYFQRAANAFSKDRTSAIADLRKASSIWEELEEYELAAKAEYRALQLEDSVPKVVSRTWESESFATRVTAIRLRAQQMETSSRSKAARRDAPGLEYWADLVQSAKKQNAIKQVNW